MNFGNGTSSEEQLIYYFVSLFYHNAKNRYEYIDKQSGISVEADIYIPDERIVIEYDDGYWHKEKVKKDAQKNVFFNSHGCFVIRVRDEGLPSLPEFNGTCITRIIKHVYDPSYHLYFLRNYVLFFIGDV